MRRCFIGIWLDVIIQAILFEIRELATSHRSFRLLNCIQRQKSFLYLLAIFGHFFSHITHSKAQKHASAITSVLVAFTLTLPATLPP